MKGITIPMILCLCITYVNTKGNRPPYGSKPNIVVLLADDLGIGDVGCFGNTTLPTPNIDSLARDGAKMTHFLTAAAICTPSRAAFLTGRYPIRSGMSGVSRRPVIMFTGSTGGLPPQEITFAEILKEAGYSTGLIGKWHLGLNKKWPGDNEHNPRNQGFDYWFGIPLSLAKNMDEEEDLTILKIYPRLPLYSALTTLAGFVMAVILWRKQFISLSFCLLISVIFGMIIHYPLWMGTHVKFLNSMLYRNYELVEQPLDFDGLTRRLTQEGVDFLEARQIDEAPFLLYMSWLQVHVPLHAGPRFQKASKHGRYGDEVMEFDWSVGEILKALDRLGMRENTLVLFTSDNGGHVETHGWRGERHGGYNGIYSGGKAQGSMDGGIRVPTLIRWPAQIAPQTEIDIPASNMDFLPTVADVAGVEIPTDRVIDGVSMLPILTGSKEERKRDYLVHYCSDQIYAVRFKPDDDGAIWKLRYATPKFVPGTQGCQFGCLCDAAYHIIHDPPLVFDMAANPQEDKPLPQTDPRFPKIVQAAKDAVKEHRASLVEVENQLGIANWIFRPYLMPCCNFPFCSCKDEKRKI